MKEEKETIFKRCTTCGTRWRDRASFMADLSVEFLGYQPMFEGRHLGYFLFNHVTDCTTTLAISVDEFRDLYDGPVWQEFKFGTEDCPGYCAHLGEDGQCPAKCICTWVLAIMNVLKAWPKTPS